MADVKRRYRAPSRDSSAERTRQRILDAAGALFLRDGYVATTVAQIAHAAGVSRPTVFAVGSKPELFARIRDRAIAGDDEPVPIVARPEWQHMIAEPVPRTVLTRYARISAGINQRYAAVHVVLQQSAGAAAELATLYERAEEERRIGARAAVENVLSKGPVVLPVPAAVDVVWVLTSPGNYHRLVNVRDWTHAAYVEWLSGAFVAALLGEGPGQRAGQYGH